MNKLKNRIITTLLIASLLIPMITAASTNIVEASPSDGDKTIYAFVGTTLRASTQIQPGGPWSNGEPGSTQNHSWNFDLFRFITDTHHAGKLMSGLSPENIEIVAYGAYDFDVTDEQTTLYPNRAKSRTIADYNINYPGFRAYNINMTNATYDPTTGQINASASYTFDARNIFNIGSAMNRVFLTTFETNGHDHNAAITSMRQVLLDFYSYQSSDPAGVLAGATTDNLQRSLNAYEPRAMTHPENVTFRDVRINGHTAYSHLGLQPGYCDGKPDDEWVFEYGDVVRNPHPNGPIVYEGMYNEIRVVLIPYVIYFTIIGDVSDLTQVDIIEDHEGNHVSTSILTPNMSGENVLLSSTPARELREWVTSDTKIGGVDDGDGVKYFSCD